ncbi:MAG: hypothetical protein IPL74_00855 [Bacteroidetes bacterium]|nr:hypothetical protein [Bacteroidota bacterium]
MDLNTCIHSIRPWSHAVTPTAASTVYTVQAIDNTAGPFMGCGALSTVTV